VANADNMRTRGKSGFIHPVDRLNLNAVLRSPLPVSVRSAHADPDWRADMQSEFDALKANDTWSLVPRPPGVSIVTGKWFFGTNFRQMALLTIIKLVGFCVVLLNILALTMMRL
jgi:hypothetical protein